MSCYMIEIGRRPLQASLFNQRRFSWRLLLWYGRCLQPGEGLFHFPRSISPVWWSGLSPWYWFYWSEKVVNPVKKRMKTITHLNSAIERDILTGNELELVCRLFFKYCLSHGSLAAITSMAYGPCVMISSQGISPLDDWQMYSWVTEDTTWWLACHQ